MTVKNLFKLRDQKQIDFEELTVYLNTHQTERDHIKSTGKGIGIGGYLKDKINEFKGVDPEKMRADRIERLEQKVTHLEEAVQTSKQVSHDFSQAVIDEMQHFTAFKDADFKAFMCDYCDTQLGFHEKVFSVDLEYQVLG